MSEIIIFPHDKTDEILHLRKKSPEWKRDYFDLYFPDISYYGSSIPWISVGLGNGSNDFNF